jgi:hypothetical protein
MERAQAGPTPAPESPYPYLDKLQPKMEEMLTREIPGEGRFCGFCYGRARKGSEVCEFCGHPFEQVGLVSRIPTEVQQMYLLKRKREGLIVHLGAFAGLLIGAGSFLALVLNGVHPVIGFAVLLFGSYLLAQLCGPIIGGQFGYAWGARERDRLWSEYLVQRDGQGAASSR